MSNINKTSKNLKNKLSLDSLKQSSVDTSVNQQDSKDIKHRVSIASQQQAREHTSKQSKQPESQHTDQELSRQDIMNMLTERNLQKLASIITAETSHEITSSPAKSKLKSTFYLDQATDDLFTEVYIKRLQERRKTDKSQLICEAIALLHKQELT